MSNKQNSKKSKTQKTSNGSLTNDVYNGMGNCTSSKNSTDIGKMGAKSTKSHTTDCNH